MASGAAVGMHLVVTNNLLKHPWVPDVKEAGGRTYMKLDKWCRHFCLFVTGKGLDLRRSKRTGINSRFLEDLQKLRTAANDKVIGEYLRPPDDGTGERRKAKKARKARAADMDIAPSHITIEVPMVVRGGHVYSATKMYVMFGVKNFPLWVEATSSNLEHIRAGILTSMETDEAGRHWASKKPEQADSSTGDCEDDVGDEVDVGDEADGDDRADQ